MPPPDYIKVLDLGVAKMAHGDEGPRLTATGEVVGTPEYLSPERAGGGTVDHRCDLYSLGIILYRMLTGRRPFQDRSKLRLVRRQQPEAPQPFSALVLPQQVPPQLEAVVMRLLEKDPARRYQTCEEVRRARAEAKGISVL
jgi:serine/threonine-protein kinase